MPSTACSGGPAASEKVSFSDPLVSSPSQQEQPRIRLGTVFLLPHREVLHAPSSSFHKGGTRSANRNHLQGLTSDLICSSSRPVLMGEPFGGCLCPWFVATPARQQPCTPAPLYSAYSLCILAAVYTVVNQRRPHRCLDTCSSTD
jgi:hypothetical protein